MKSALSVVSRGVRGLDPPYSNTNASASNHEPHTLHTPPFRTGPTLQVAVTAAGRMDFGDDATGYANMEVASSWWQLAGAVACVICAAFAAGLTVGLMSLDPLELEVKRRVGTPDERKHAEKICPLIARHHRLLVTLLLFNSIANEALPIFLSGLVPGYVAVLLSVTAILIFGEIIPSALFTGPNQIVMAARFSGFVLFLMGLFWPIAYPIAHVLDKWLGHNSFKRYTREELSTLVDLQREAGVVKHRRPPGAAGGAVGAGAHAHSAKEKELGESMRAITVDEATIVAGVLKCHAKKICDALKPMDEVYTLCEDDVLDENMLCEIMACGYSRIPVHSTLGRQDIRGFLLVKRLIVLDPADRRPVRTLPLRQPIVVSPTGSLLELINVFQEGRSHMAIVSSCPDLTRQALRTGKPLEGRIAPIGIITLEDLFEEILQEEIYDEHDDRVGGFLFLVSIVGDHSLSPFSLSPLSACSYLLFFMLRCTHSFLSIPFSLPFFYRNGRPSRPSSGCGGRSAVNDSSSRKTSRTTGLTR